MENGKIKTIFLVVKERKKERLSETHAFSDKETALAFAQEQINYYHNKIYKPKAGNFFMDFFKGKYYINNKFDISLNEIGIDYIVPKKIAQLKANCLAK